MSRQELILAALSTARGGSFSPVEIQKMFFLIDKNIPEEVCGPHFDFKPWNYGPFDKSVYFEMNKLSDEGLVNIEHFGRLRSYKNSIEGQSKGEELFSQLSEKAKKYIADISYFVRKCTFSQLVTAIYRDYPEMKVNSVFQG